MKKTFLLIAVPALLVAMGLAQTPAASGNTDQVNVKGCLGGTDGNYTVAEDGTGKIFKISATSADLKAYSGQEVKLSGNNGFGENSLVVTAVNMISEHCTASAAAPAAAVGPSSESISVAPAAAAAPAPALTETIGTAPPAAAAPTAAAPAATVRTPVQTASVPADAVHRTQASDRRQKPAAAPAAAPAPAKPVSTPVADAAVPTAAVDPQEADSTPVRPAPKPSFRGSTLMIVAIAVVLLLLGIALPLYSRSRKQKLLDQAGGENLSFTHRASSDPGTSDTTAGRKAA